MMSSSQSGKTRSAFTLVELLVVIAIIGILIGMLLPAVQQVREAARRINCANNIRQLSIASQNYEGSFKKLPPGLYQNVDASSIRFYGYTWAAAILPQMEQGNLHDLWNFTDSGAAAVTNGLDAAGNPTTDAPSATPIATMLCPSDSYNSNVVELTYTGSGYPTGYFGLTSYVGNGGTYSTYFNSSAMQDDGSFFMTGPNSGQSWQPNLTRNAREAGMVVKDGSSNTFMFGERYHEDKNFTEIIRGGSDPTQYSRYAIDEWGVWGWYGGGNGTTHALASTQMPLNYRTPATATPGYTEVNNRMSAYGSGHPAGANFAMMDGSVQFISSSIDFVTYQALSTRQGSEIVSDY
jgi:prepilin-type N-terminal cleavage/methylation domain-containing protein/prepilin-type processing-associated H-X9-DG protein